MEETLGKRGKAGPSSKDAKFSFRLQAVKLSTQVVPPPLPQRPSNHGWSNTRPLFPVNTPAHSFERDLGLPRSSCTSAYCVALGPLHAPNIKMRVSTLCSLSSLSIGRTDSGHLHPQGHHSNIPPLFMPPPTLRQSNIHSRSCCAMRLHTGSPGTSTLDIS